VRLRVCGAYGLRLRVWGLGFRLRVWGLGFGVYGWV